MDIKAIANISFAINSAISLIGQQQHKCGRMELKDEPATAIQDNFTAMRKKACKTTSPTARKNTNNTRAEAAEKKERDWG